MMIFILLFRYPIVFLNCFYAFYGWIVIIEQFEPRFDWRNKPLQFCRDTHTLEYTKIKSIYEPFFAQKDHIQEK